MVRAVGGTRLPVPLHSIPDMSFDATDEPHSAAFLNALRDFWWNFDYLQLVARRLRLDAVRSALDVGAGLGQWSTLLLPLLAPEATIVGVERDPRWVRRAQARAAELGVAERCRFVQGVAESLNFEDGTFDLVTCQTLLIHVSDVPAVIGEMCRVARTGGLILAAEPNNIAGMLVADSVSKRRPVAELTERLEFALICERGKAALGEGNNSIGDLLPGYFIDAGLTEIQAFLNDKAFMLAPPYRQPEQHALKREVVADVASNRWIWSEPEAKRYYLAGGGAQEEFELRWQRRLTEARETAHELEADRLYTTGGGIHYVISGRRAN